jgi:DNA-directed RNA polymerase subunit RPC12/RpoP
MSKPKVYGPYKERRGRKIVILVYPDGKRETVSYPKYLVEQALGVKLDKDLGTIDHIDGNYDNNHLSNLKIVPRREHSAMDTRRVKLVKYKCLMCGEDFERSPRLIRDKAKKGKSGPYCSKSCAGKYARLLQLKKIKKNKKQEHIKSEYFKNKNLEALEKLVDNFIKLAFDL